MASEYYAWQITGQFCEDAKIPMPYEAKIALRYSMKEFEARCPWLFDESWR